MRRMIIVIAAVIVIAATVLAVNLYVTASRAKKLAGEAISALQNVNSALKVGVTIIKYNEMVIDSQAKVDAYVSKFGTKRLHGLGAKLIAAQACYVDAGDLWQWSIEANRKDPPVPGSHWTLSTLLSDEDALSFEPIYERCVDRYPQIRKTTGQGGAVDDGLTRLTGSPNDSLDITQAQQIIWSIGEKAVESLLTSR